MVPALCFFQRILIVVKTASSAISTCFHQLHRLVSTYALTAVGTIACFLCVGFFQMTLIEVVIQLVVGLGHCWLAALLSTASAMVQWELLWLDLLPQLHWFDVSKWPKHLH
jgi:hypothetical protein